MPLNTIQLAARLASRGIKRVVHFHVDHFEPGRLDLDEQRIGLAHTRSWIEQVKKLPWGPKASLFYFSRWLTPVREQSSRESRRRQGLPLYPVHDMTFGHSSMADEDTGIVQLLIEEQMDFHIHVHHEHWCSGPVRKQEVNEAGDSARLSAFLDLLLERYRELKVPLPGGWGFVHGCWALNASDRSICQIIDECLILQARGCIGDFSFPAGRPWCDPTVHPGPLTIRPIAIERCYDQPAAEPRALTPVDLRDPTRFIVWNDVGMTGNYASADNIMVHNIAPQRVLEMWTQGSATYGSTLYLKTHAHSLWWERWRGPNGMNTSPLLHPSFSGAMEELHRVCALIGATVEHQTVREVLQELRGSEVPG